MADLNRRQALAIGIGAVASAALPASAAVAAPITEAAKPELVAWMVGTPGEWDWQMIKARTYDEAIRDFVCEAVGGDGCEEGSPEDCDCEWCWTIGGLEASRTPAWDGKEDVTAADWLRAGWGATCSRCRDEVEYDGGFPVGDKAIHSDCMTRDDWEAFEPRNDSEIRRKTLALTSHKGDTP